MNQFNLNPIAAALAFTAASVVAPFAALANDEPPAEAPSLPEVIVQSAQNVLVAMADGIGQSGQSATIITDGAPFSAESFRTSMFSQMGSAGRRVVGAPYSAEIVTERVQILPDGNQISRKQSQMVYRDSEGRTRQDRIDDNGRSTVLINDPVAKSRVVLSPSRRWAYQLPVVDVDGMLSKLRTESADALKNAKNAKGEISVRINDGEARVKTFALSANGQIRLSTEGQGVAPTEKRIDIADVFQFDRADGIGGALRESLSALSPLLGASGTDALVNLRTEGGNTSTKALGARDFSGVRADGTLTTRTIPAGSIGNKAAINVTSESWYAPDLQITLYSKHSDPRYGDTIYRVSNLQRSEPAADLFKVPADYNMRGRGESSKAR
jgi:hypothetical protein